MELSDLTAYARERYQMEEQFKWPDFPGFSILAHPQTGEWVALLMRQWDTDSGEEIQRCDLKCGMQVLLQSHSRYLSGPIRMHGPKWIGIAFLRETDPETVFRLFDRAMSLGNPRGFAFVLETPSQPADHLYRDTPLHFPGRAEPPVQEVFPERIRQMKHLYDYSSTSAQARAENFCRQGRFMEDFEDEAPWPGGFTYYLPTYHDMTTRQLRGYFSWRTHIRKGDFQPISASAAYIYLYELLNGIGTSSVSDSLEKLDLFKTRYLDAGMGDLQMRSCLHKWMMDLAVIRGLPPETAQKYMDPGMLKRDLVLMVLQSPAEHSDEDLFDALAFMDGKRLNQSPVFSLPSGNARHLFCEVWRSAVTNARTGEKSLFALCFGEPRTSSWYPLANAVYLYEDQPDDRIYRLDPCRSFQCRNGVWQMHAYESLSFDKNRFHGFLRQTDLMLRRHFKTGHYLKEKPEDAWAAPYVLAAIEAEERAAAEAARPKITIDLSGLDQIRRDALITRDSLLTEEERSEQEPPESKLPPEAPSLPPAVRTDLPLDGVQLRILRALLNGQSADGIVRSEHLMPSMAADAINDALYDEIGDNAVDCENDRLSLVEDYREDIAQLLGGTGE